MYCPVGGGLGGVHRHFLSASHQMSIFVLILNSTPGFLCGIHNDFNGKSCSKQGEDSFYQQLGIKFKEALVKCYTTYARTYNTHKEGEPHPHCKRKQDMSTTEYLRYTNPIKQLGPHTPMYKEPPATVHGDNRAHV
jgi:hypothetical protein